MLPALWQPENGLAGVAVIRRGQGSRFVSRVRYFVTLSVWFGSRNQRLGVVAAPGCAPVMKLTLDEVIDDEKAKRLFRWDRGQIAKND